MDTDALETLALADDRAAALAQLLPGTPEYDYWQGVLWQHAGRLDEVDALLAQWWKRHNRTDEDFHRLTRRQLLLRAAATPEACADAIRSACGVSLNDQAEAEVAAQRYPTRLDLAQFDTFVQSALAPGAHLSYRTPASLAGLLAHGDALDDAQRRELLAQLSLPTLPGVVALIARDLVEPASPPPYGTFELFKKLTLAQLVELAELRPGLMQQPVWVENVMARFVPPAHVDVRDDLRERSLWLDHLWTFVSQLAPSFNALKAQVLYHRLDLDRRLDVYDRARFLAYLALPRQFHYVHPLWLSTVPGDRLVRPASNVAPAAKLDPIADDEPLVREYLYRFLQTEDSAAFAEFLRADWLADLLATTRLLSGAPDADRWAATLGASRVSALREQVELELTARNPTRLAPDAAVALEVDVKNVASLAVKVFRINALAYFQARGAEPDTALDLDGMVASTERTLRFDEAPMRRVRRRIEIPEADRPGTYVVELIGNGRSSRALLRKGSLRHIVRTSVAGPVVYVFDDAGRPLDDAKLWLGGREYTPRDDGGIAVPFSTSPAEVSFLLVHGDVTQREWLKHPAETYELSLGMHLDPESVVAGRTARLLLRPMLTVAEAPATVAVLDEPRVDVAITDRKGVSSTKSHAVTLRDDAETVVEVFVPDGAATLSVTLRARVRNASTQQTQELVSGVTMSVNAVHGTAQTQSLYLAQTASGYVLSLLGKTGEPVARRAVSVSLKHASVTYEHSVTLETDARGRVELGALRDVVQVTASVPSCGARVWVLRDALSPPAALHALAGDPLAIPAPPGVTAENLAHSLALIEMRGEFPRRDAAAHVSLDGRALVFSDLEPGRYELRCDAMRWPMSLVVAPSSSAVAESWVTSGPDLIELSPTVPTVRALSVNDAQLTLQLAGASAQTRVHLVATRYLSRNGASASIERDPRTPERRAVQPVRSHFASGRDIGEEYRYVLDRRAAARRPGVLLEKPGLLLNPWALRTTSTAVQSAKGGGAYAPSAQRAAAAAPQAEAAYDAYGMAAEAQVSFDHHSRPAVVLANLRPDADGVIRVARAELGDAQRVQVMVVDPALTSVEEIALEERDPSHRDLRLKLALDASKHFSEDRRVEGVSADTELVVEDIRTGRLELVDTLARAHQVLLTLTSDSALREFSFVTRWHALDDAARRTLYSKYACHELHLFLHEKDPGFFARVVAPYLASKRVKTFIDRWLLGDDLSEYASPWAFSRLNALEKVLLARRLPALREAVTTLVGDAVDLQRVDPDRDARLMDTLLGAAVLEGGGLGGAAASAAMDMLSMADEAPMEKSESRRMAKAAPPPRPQAPSPGAMARAPMMMMPGMPPPAPAPSAGPMGGAFGSRGGGDFDDSRVARDMATRREAVALYRGADKTQEWAESDWWHRRVAESVASLIAPNRFWRDLANHREGPFLSAYLGDCATHATEALCALAFVGLPFEAAKHDTAIDDTRMTLTARSPALAARTRLLEGEAPVANSPILVGQSYFRADDRFEWDGAEQREKYITGEFLTGVVYQCLVVVTNTSSTAPKLDVLLQIPRGAVPVSDGFLTRTIHLQLGAYGTSAQEYAFYFPAAGRWTHFPAHVSRAGALVAAAAPRELDVVTELTAVDTASWAHVSQRGTDSDVLAFLSRANLGRVDLTRIAWRMRDKGVFTRVTDLLASRQHYHDRLWAWSLQHGDRARMAEWLAHQEGFLRGVGPALDGALVTVDPTARGWYEHLEYAPLINARAHQLGAKRRILNDSLAAQYKSFLELVAHRRSLTDDDRLASAHYLFCLDRIDDALAAFAKVRPERVASKLQYDYLAAYGCCCRGDLVAARRYSDPWREHPVDRWRSRFATLGAMLDEAQGARHAPVSDPDSRDQRMASLAAREPALELSVEHGAVVLQHANLDSCQLRFYRMDIELLFSRQPFVQGDVERFSWIDPGHVAPVTFGSTGRTTVALPESLRGTNLVIEAVAVGLRKVAVHYAHDLATSVAQSYGQVRVLRASSQTPLSAVYVKVYARQRGGAVAFYKDGYTDLCGRFDYVTLSTDDLDRVERFALLVVSDDAGAAVLEAAPPLR